MSSRRYFFVLVVPYALRRTHWKYQSTKRLWHRISVWRFAIFHRILRVIRERTISLIAWQASRNQAGKVNRIVDETQLWRLKLLANNTQWNFYLTNIVWIAINTGYWLEIATIFVKPQLTVSRNVRLVTTFAVLSTIMHMYVYGCITVLHISLDLPLVFFLNLSCHPFVRISESLLVSLSAPHD